MARMTRKFYTRPADAAKDKHAVDVNIVPTFTHQPVCALPFTLRLYGSTGIALLHMDEYEALKLRDFLNREFPA